MMERFELKKHTYIGLADTTFRLYRRQFKLFFKITAIFFLVPLFLQKIFETRLGYSLGISSVFSTVFSDLLRPDYYEYSIRNYGYRGIPDTETVCCLVFAVFIFKVFLTALCAGPIIRATGKRLFGEPVDLRDALRIGARGYLYSVLMTFVYIFSLSVVAVGMTVLLSFLMMFFTFSFADGLFYDAPCLLYPCGCIFFTLPYGLIIYLGVRYSMFIQGIILEGTSGIGGMIRSSRLVRGYWWFCWRVIVGVVFIQGIITFSSETMFRLLSNLVTAWKPELEIVCQTISAVGLTLVHLFVFPMIIIALTLLFYEIKVNKEAYDLEVMIDKF